jgi:hypothetical protein
MIQDYLNQIIGTGEEREKYKDTLDSFLSLSGHFDHIQENDEEVELVSILF